MDNFENKNNSKTSIVNILRWILVLPVLFITYYLSDFFAQIILTLSSRLYPAAIVELTILDILRFMGINFASVLSAGYTAPKYKRITSIVLTTIMGLISIISCLLYFRNGLELPAFVHILNCLSGITGAIIGSHTIFHQFDEKE